MQTRGTLGKLSALLLAVGAVTLTGLSAGCDQNKIEDAAVRDAINQAVATKDGDEAEQAKAASTIEAAVPKAANDQSKALALLLSGQINLEQGRDLAVSASVQRTEADALAFTIYRLATQAGSGKRAAAGLALLDPKKSLDALAGTVAAAKGDGNKETWPVSQQVELPTLNAVRLQISNLESEIAKKDAEIQQLTRQRDSLLEQSGQAQAQSEREKGQQAVDTFKRAADLRQQASNLSTQIADVENAKIPLVGQLASARDAERVVDTGIKDYEGRAAAMQAGWKEVSARAQKHQDAATAFVSGGPALDELNTQAKLDPKLEPITGQAASLKAKIEAEHKLRDDAVAKLTAAVDAYRNAEQAANSVLKPPSDATPAETAAQKITATALHPVVAKYGQVQAQNAIASLWRDEAASALRRLQAARAVEAAKLPAVDAIGDPGKDFTQAIANADQAITAATEQLDNIIGSAGSTPKELRQAALSGKVLTLYTRVQLRRLQQANGGADEPEVSKALAEVIKARDEATNNQAPLPPLPSDVAAAPAAPTAPAGETPAAPATPATPAAPATPPADGAAQPATPAPAAPATPAAPAGEGGDNK